MNESLKADIQYYVNYQGFAIYKLNDEYFTYSYTLEKLESTSIIELKEMIDNILMKN